MLSYTAVYDFWFSELSPAQWWQKSDDIDREIVDRFGKLLDSAAACELYHWRSEPRGRLAEVVVLDQFSRHIYRERPGAFANDALALGLAQEAVSAGADRRLSTQERTFLYMPYMHSESPAIHTEAVELFSANGVQDNLDFEQRHKAIIDRFGRYPHRNAILGRPSTEEELQFLLQPGSHF